VNPTRFQYVLRSPSCRTCPLLCPTAYNSHLTLHLRSAPFLYAIGMTPSLTSHGVSLRVELADQFGRRSSLSLGSGKVLRFYNCWMYLVFPNMQQPNTAVSMNCDSTFNEWRHKELTFTFCSYDVHTCLYRISTNVNENISLLTLFNNALSTGLQNVVMDLW